MAKISANGAHKVKGYRVDLPADGDRLSREHYVLRSDGVILTAYQTAIQYTGQPLYWGSRNLAMRWRVKDARTFDLLKFVQKQHPDAVSITES